MAEEPKVEKQPIKPPAQLLEEFLDKERLIITALPQFVSTNHGSFEIAITVGVQKRTE
jgi:hypothetical protein